MALIKEMEVTDGPNLAKLSACLTATEILEMDIPVEITVGELGTQNRLDAEERSITPPLVKHLGYKMAVSIRSLEKNDMPTW